MISLPKADKVRTRRLEVGEEQKLLETNNQKLRRIIVLALETGMRRGEILNIKRSHIDFQKSVLLIPTTKTDRGGRAARHGNGAAQPGRFEDLARHAPPQWQPFVFSVKQSGTPLGGMLAGLLLPPLMVLYDWRVAVVAISAIPLATLFGLQLIRSNLDDDRNPAFRISFTGILTSLRLILTSRAACDARHRLG